MNSIALFYQDSLDIARLKITNQNWLLESRIYNMDFLLYCKYLNYLFSIIGGFIGYTLVHK